MTFLTDFLKILKYQISLKSTQWELSFSMLTDGQTDMRKLTVAFRTFATAPINEDVCVRLCKSLAVNAGVKL